MFLLSLAAFASAASLRATDPLLPLIAEEYGVSAGAASAAVTAFALSYGLLQVVCGPLGDRYGRYRTIAAAAFVSAFGSAACALAPSLDMLVAARFVSGATIGAFIPLALAWIGDTVADEKRQPLLARFLVGQMAGVPSAPRLPDGSASISAGARFSSRSARCFLPLRFAGPGIAPTLSRNRAPRVDPRKPETHAAAALQRQLQVLLATGYAEGAFIFGALAFVAIHLQRATASARLAGTLVTAYAAGGPLRAARAGRSGASASAASPRWEASRWCSATRTCVRHVIDARDSVHCLRGSRLLHAAHDGADARHACRAGRARLGGRAFRDFSSWGRLRAWLGAQIVDAAGLAPVFWLRPSGSRP